MRRKCSPKILVFSAISFVAIFSAISEIQYIIERHLHDTESLDAVVNAVFAEYRLLCVNCTAAVLTLTVTAHLHFCTSRGQTQ